MYLATIILGQSPSIMTMAHCTKYGNCEVTTTQLDVLVM